MISTYPTCLLNSWMTGDGNASSFLAFYWWCACEKHWFLLTNALLIMVTLNYKWWQLLKWSFTILTSTMKGDDKLFFWQAYYSSDNGNNWMTVSTFYSDGFKIKVWIHQDEWVTTFFWQFSLTLTTTVTSDGWQQHLLIWLLPWYVFSTSMYLLAVLLWWW